MIDANLVQINGPDIWPTLITFGEAPDECRQGYQTSDG